MKLINSGWKLAFPILVLGAATIPVVYADDPDADLDVTMRMQVLQDLRIELRRQHEVGWTGQTSVASRNRSNTGNDRAELDTITKPDATVRGLTL